MRSMKPFFWAGRHYEGDRQKERSGKGWFVNLSPFCRKLVGGKGEKASHNPKQ